MKNVVKTIIVSLTVCLLAVVPGLGQSAQIDLSKNTAIFQGGKPPERPKERPKEDKNDRRDERRDDKEKKDEKKKKPDF